MSAAIIDISNDRDAADASLLDSQSFKGGDDSSSSSSHKSILFFWAAWHAPSNTGGPFDTVVRTLAEQNNDGTVKFYRVLAEDAPKLSRKVCSCTMSMCVDIHQNYTLGFEYAIRFHPSHTTSFAIHQYNVSSVPTFIFINTDGTVLDRVDGGEDVAAVTQYYTKLVNTVTSTTTTSSSSIQNQPQPPDEPATTQSSEQQTIDNRLRAIITSSPIMLFLKGTPTAPRCGFSRQAVELLTSSNVSFAYFDILEDDDVRQGLKAYSDWPTYPQFYVRGELVGGLDIMKELMEEEGGLVQQLDLGEFVIKNDVASTTVLEQKVDEKDVSINERLKHLINRHRIMLFMKGIPSSPRCGFSRQIVEILDSFHVSYDAFNILEDDDVREGLKKYSDWPTYPQLYVEGDLVGGLDIVKEMVESGDMEDLLRGSGRD